jgi:hypothetical protein
MKALKLSKQKQNKQNIHYCLLKERGIKFVNSIQDLIIGRLTKFMENRKQKFDVLLQSTGRKSVLITFIASYLLTDQSQDIQ